MVVFFETYRHIGIIGFGNFFTHTGIIESYVLYPSMCFLINYVFIKKKKAFFQFCSEKITLQKI
ncbi:hypothetical protein EGI26_19250 [Lacihabitans sp. CCS-44]|nr:hypothetical protein [Lacihabitans sp. CCS-44]